MIFGHTASFTEQIFPHGSKHQKHQGQASHIIKGIQMAIFLSLLR